MQNKPLEMRAFCGIFSREIGTENRVLESFRTDKDRFMTQNQRKTPFSATAATSSEKIPYLVLLQKNTSTAFTDSSVIRLFC